MFYRNTAVMAPVTWLLLSGCSLIIDTNPDGVIYTGGAAGQSSEHGGGTRSDGGRPIGGTVSLGGTAAVGGLNAGGGPSIGGGIAAVAGGSTAANAGASVISGGAVGIPADAGGQPSAIAGAAGIGGGIARSGRGGIDDSLAGTSTAAGSGSTAGMSASSGKGSGGAATGGTATGGVATGGLGTGGAIPSTGGAATGGNSTGCTSGLEERRNGLCVSKLVTIGTGSASYGIDATEVSRSQYAEWLSTATTVTINAQDPTTCGWNTTLQPNPSCMSEETVCQGANCANHPQVCVDWCDAYAYCKAVGKRLCGKIGGGMNAFVDFANASLSQWYSACTSMGTLDYPYGDAYNPIACNGIDYWNAQTSSTWTTTPVGYLQSCQAPVPYAGVYDMSGNVWEWEDSCDSTSTGATAHCRIRGGS